MSDELSTTTLGVLRPSVAAARRALEQMEDDDVPAALRRVAAYRGGRLPPPLARSLLRALDRDDGLREDAAGEYGADDDGSASWAYLHRPDGWWRRLVAAVDEAASDAGADRLAAAEQSAADLQQRLAEAKRRARRRSEPDPGAGRDDAALGALRKALDQERAAVADGARALEEARGDALRAGEQAARARADLKAVRAELKSLKRERASLRRDRDAEAGPWRAADPRDLARRLDATAAAASRRHRHAGEDLDDDDEEREPAVLPSGIAPDTAAAFDYVLGRNDAVLVLVDGHNAAFALSGRGFHEGEARRRLEAELRAARRQAAGPLPITVVYDSSVGADRTAPGAGIEVVYTEPGVPADAELVARAGRARPAVVVSNDREVREDAEAAGALALWSDALVSWIARRT